MDNRLLGTVLIAGAAWMAFSPAREAPKPATPVVKPAPAPAPKPAPKPKRRPWGEREAPVGATVDGPSHAGVEIQCDLPAEFHKKNIASSGLGCCVFRSIDHAAHWQNVPALYGFPEWMVKSGVPGGGYPSKVADLIPKICKDRNLPVPEYVQWENNDLDLLRQACGSGRMVCITYSFSPSGRYGGSRIAHMVNLVHADKDWFVILDNNYVDGESHYEWLTPDEFIKTYSGGQKGWSFVLLGPPPPPCPKGNGK